jgi:DNA (cytosine-5)-methyltransferase 1
MELEVGEAGRVRRRVASQLVLPKRLPVDYTCPVKDCGYGWKGSPRPAGGENAESFESEDADQPRQEALLEVEGGEGFRCPWCGHEWEGDPGSKALVPHPARGAEEALERVFVREAKPVYRVPSLKEIRELPMTGLRAFSTFSGCGGSCLGFRMAGFDVLWANEFIQAARETYAANHPTPLDGRDIRLVDPEEILRVLGLKVGELDVLEGSPPCASFSSAGKKAGGWGEVRKYSDTKQRTDDLFREYVRLLRGFKPRAFVAENVSGLTAGVARGYFNKVMELLEESGYVVEARVLDAAWLGVPQSRHRTIFVGIRDDLGRRPRWPTYLDYQYTLREALDLRNGRVVHDTSGKWSEGDVTDQISPVVLGTSQALYVEEPKPIEAVIRKKPLGLGREAEENWVAEYQELSLDEPAPVVMAHGMGGVREYQVGLAGSPEDEDTRIDKYAIAKEWDKLEAGQISRKYLNLIKPDEEKPSPTVTQTGGIMGAASVTHPTERRKFTLRELRRVCGFPDDFVLTGNYRQGWERLGRAVPPLMMAAIATSVRDVLLEEKPS